MMKGDELRQLRKARGYKAYELASKLDIGLTTLSRYERGHRPVPKPVEYAVRWLCRDPEGDTPGKRLIRALEEALQPHGQV
jgi:transcriptional regulator with XRE-family HTH domain